VRQCSVCGTAWKAESVSLMTLMERRKLNLKAKFGSVFSYSSFQRLDSGAFNVGFIGSTCTALP